MKQSVATGTVVVRAHGIPLPELRLLKARHRQQSLRLINGTCPEVAKVQARIKRYASKGYFIVLLGTRGHAEVVAHESYASNGCAVVSSLIEAQQLTFSADQRVLVIAQTTFLTVDFEEIAAHFRNRVRNCVVLNTICKDTGRRQNEAETLCRRSDYLIVIGGRASNNTRHLMELATAAGKPVQWVESSIDLDLGALRNMHTVGVLAGASTPTWTVDEVIETLRQAGQPSRWRSVARFAQTLDLPFTTALAVLTWLLHGFLNWPTGWMGPVLPTAFHLACRAGLPYLHPHHLAAKGQVQEAFLIRHRRGLLLLAGMLGLVTFLCAFQLGLWMLSGLLLLATWLALYPAGKKRMGLQRLLAGKDLGEALPPTLLAV